MHMASMWASKLPAKKMIKSLGVIAAIAVVDGIIWFLPPFQVGIALTIAVIVTILITVVFYHP